MRIPLFVSASGILVALALGFAWIFQELSETYERRYLRAWKSSWVALAVYSLFAGLALLAVNVPALASFRTVFALGSMAAAFVHMRALLVGMQRLCAPERLASRWPLRAIASLIIAAAVLVLVPVEPRSDAAMRTYLVRVGLLAAAWGLAYGTAGVMMLRRPPGASDRGRQVLLLMLFTGVVLWWQGRRRWHEGLLLRRDSPRPLLWQLHSCIGFWTLLLVFAWGLSAVYFAWPLPFELLMDRFDDDLLDAQRPDGWLLFLIDLHFGRFRGTLWAALLWVPLGLLPAFMYVSGFLLWYRRVLQRR